MNHRNLWTQKYASHAATHEHTQKRSKYGNVRANGTDSKREARRIEELRIMQRAGLILDLQTQVRFEIIPGNDRYRPTYYVADATYTDAVTGEQVVEDTKMGAPGSPAHAAYLKTPAGRLYAIKRKLMYHVHGIKILEV